MLCWGSVVAIILYVDPDKVRDVGIAGLYLPIVASIGISSWYSMLLATKSIKYASAVTLIVLVALIMMIFQVMNVLIAFALTGMLVFLGLTFFGQSWYCRDMVNKMSKSIENQVYKILYQVMADMKSEEEMEILLKSLLTESELLAVSKRLAIAVFLDKGQSYDRIKDILKVSSATIASVSESMGEQGIQKAILKVKAEEWADMWSIKISRALEKLLK